MKKLFWTFLAVGAMNLAATAQTTNAMNTNKTEIADLGGGWSDSQLQDPVHPH